MKIKFALRNVLVFVFLVNSQQTHGDDEGPTWPEGCAFIHHEKTNIGVHGHASPDVQTESACEAACAADRKCGHYWFYYGGDIRCHLRQSTPQLGEILTGKKAELWLYPYNSANIGIKDCDAITPDNGWVKHENKAPRWKFSIQSFDSYWNRPLSLKQCQSYCAAWPRCHSVSYYKPADHIFRCILNTVSITELYETGRGDEIISRDGRTTFDRPLSCAESGIASQKRSSQDTQPSFGEEHRSLADAGDKTQNTLDDQPGQDLVASSQLLDKDGAGSNTGESDHQAPAPESPGA